MPGDMQLLGLIALGLALAGVVKGATGLGYSSCALPLLVYALGLKQAIAIVLMPAMATNIAVALGNGHLLETCRRFAPLYVAMLPGIALGIALLFSIDQRVAVLILGSTIVGYSLFAIARPAVSLPAGTARVLQAPVGFVNGVLTGLTGSQVMPLVPFVMALNLDPARLVQAINLGVLLASLVLAAALLATGAVGETLLTASVAAIFPALIGVEIGQYLRRFLPAEHFRLVVLLVLLVSGVGMLMR